VLITRPLGTAGETARRVAAMGLRPVLAPLSEIRPIAVRLPPPSRLQAVLITSGNAVPALPPAYRDLPLLAVGDATAARARAAGFAQVASAQGDAQALVALVGEHCDPAGKPLLLAAGMDSSADPAPALRALGFTVTRRSVYRGVAVEELPAEAQAGLTGGALRAVLFFSPATAHSFVRLLLAAMPPACVSAVDALAISSAAAVALAPLPWRRIRVASRPNQDELLALLHE